MTTTETAPLSTTMSELSSESNITPDECFTDSDMSDTASTNDSDRADHFIAESMKEGRKNAFFSVISKCGEEDEKGTRGLDRVRFHRRAKTLPHFDTPPPKASVEEIRSLEIDNSMILNSITTNENINTKLGTKINNDKLSLTEDNALYRAISAPELLEITDLLVFENNETNLNIDYLEENCKTTTTPQSFDSIINRPDCPDLISSTTISSTAQCTVRFRHLELQSKSLDNLDVPETLTLDDGHNATSGSIVYDKIVEEYTCTATTDEDETYLEEKYEMTMMTRRWSVCHFSKLPKWLQDNDYLINGHRPPLGSFKGCLLSIFRIHTETGNIWSHLLGSLAFALTGFGFLSSQPMAFPEQLVFAVFFFCVFLCFFTSTMYHTMHCHSHHVGRIFSRLDYCGIISIVAGCFTPWVHFLFWCEPKTKMFYLTLAYILCTLTINLTMWDKFGRPQYRLLRASVFTGLSCCCSLLPGAHFILVHGWRTAFVELAFGWLFAMSFVALFGVALYAVRIPERFFPGKFDIMCHSHQFFHLAVIIGAYIHLRCLCVMATYRHSEQGQCGINSHLSPTIAFL